MSVPLHPFGPSDAPPPAPIDAAIDPALLDDEAHEDAPAFELMNDAAGRFVIDRDTGVVSIADDALLENEFGAIHVVRIRARERSGDVYDLQLRLRVSGRVPMIVGSEEDEALAALAAPPSPRIEITPAAHEQVQTPTPSFTLSMMDEIEAEDEPFGALSMAMPARVFDVAADLAFATALPAPAPAGADWRL